MRAGETFEGTNLRGRARWVTESVVTSSVPRAPFSAPRAQDRRAEAAGRRQHRDLGLRLRRDPRRHPVSQRRGSMVASRMAELGGSPLRSCRHRRDDLRGLSAGEYQAHASARCRSKLEENGKTVVATPLPPRTR